MDKNILFIARIYYIELVAISVTTICLIVWLISVIAKMIGNYKIDKPFSLNIVGAILLAIFLVLFVKGEMIYLKDFQYMIKKEFLYITGRVDKVGALGDMGGRRVFFVDIETGERVGIHAPTNEVKIGEIYEVMYLPHTEIGSYVKKIE